MVIQVDPRHRHRQPPGGLGGGEGDVQVDQLVFGQCYMNITGTAALCVCVCVCGVLGVGVCASLRDGKVNQVDQVNQVKQVNQVNQVNQPEGSY